MPHFPQFKRRFLKKTACAAAVLLALLLLFTAAMRHFFSEEAVKNELRAFFEAKDLVLAFDETKLVRRWLPYPEVVLHQVRIGNSTETAFSADTLTLRLKWSLLWGNVSLGRVGMDGAQVKWVQDPAGHWTVGGMAAGSGGVLPDSIVWQSAAFSAEWRGNSLLLADSNGEWEKGGDFRIEGRLGTGKPYAGTRLALEGRYQEGRFPYLNVGADAALPDGGQVRLEWSGSAEYEQSSGRLAGRDAALKLSLPDWRLETDGQVQAWQLAADGADWTDIRLTFASAYADLANSGSIRLGSLHWADGAWSVPAFQAETVFSQKRGETTVSIGGNFRRETDGSFRMEDLDVATRYLPDSGSLPLFVGQWQGKLGGSGSRLWSGALAGTLDGEAAELTVSAQERDRRAVVSVDADFSRLLLRPYLAGADGAVGIPEEWVGRWRHLIRDRLLELTVRAQLAEGAGIRAEDLDFALRADADGMQTDRFSVHLYGGSGSGRLSLQNRPQTAWTAEMDFRGVEIKPLLQDLFRFNHLSGRGNAAFALGARGLTAQEWRQSLNGKVDIRVHQGAWQGVDFASLLPTAGALPGQTRLAYDGARQTAFEDFEAQAYLENGIGYTPALHLRGKDIRLNGEGSFDIVGQTLDYAVLLDSGENRWLPLKIGGTSVRPELTLDYARIVDGLDTAAQKQAALRNILNRQWSSAVRNVSEPRADDGTPP